ncbi:MAG: hypothetical protein ABIW31_06845 [Novosphingobium sp.]
MPRASDQITARRAALHEGFLRHAGYRWLKLSAALCLALLLIYALADFRPHAGGNTWFGYASGTLGAGLILWLTALGLRKRAMTPGAWSLKAWTSAHVYLGLSLVVVATLHSSFRFGWNVHTLAYALMMLVIVSGLFGVIAYARLPVALSANRSEMTEPAMIEAVHAIDRQLDLAAQPLTRSQTDLVIAAVAQDPFGGSIVARLSGHYPHCATRAAIEALSAASPEAEKVEVLLIRREAALARLRRHLRLRGLLEAWLWVHVPATVALLAALTAHVISEFYYW